MQNFAVAYIDSVDAPQAKKIAKKYNLPYLGDVASILSGKKLLQQTEHYDYLLLMDQQCLTLKKLDDQNLGSIKVDFVEGVVAHRRKFGGGRGQDIAKAVGLKHGFTPHVLDATAGLGRDAFVLASLGCKVTLMERMPIVAALLQDGLARAELNVDIGTMVQQQMHLVHASSIESMSLAEQPDVIYLDPMYPHREKSAQVKKEMRIFQSLVGEDNDADALLAPALELAKYRVVVKRPSYAPPLANQKPSTSINMKKNRFDVYVRKAIPKNTD